MAKEEEMKFEFKPEDFSGVWAYPDRLEKEAIAARANGLLNAHLGTLPRVHGFREAEYKTWHFSSNGFIGDSGTHTALLWGIEPINKEPCPHEKHWLSYDEKTDLFDCGHCGARLKRIVTWEPVE